MSTTTTTTLETILTVYDTPAQGDPSPLLLRIGGSSGGQRAGAGSSLAALAPGMCT